jgi:hypothetical protein
MGESNEKPKCPERKKYSRTPVREFKASLSQDGSDLLFRDTTVWIIPRKYVSTIDKGHGASKDQAICGSVESEGQPLGETNGRSH